MKKLTCLLFTAALAVLPLLSVSAANDSDIAALKGTKLYVYNWGEYISDGEDDTLDINAAFEEKYGIDVIYDTYDNNEVMYTKLNGGGVTYDIVIPSDYMIERMIKEDMLAKIDYANIPNYKYINVKYKGLPYDPTNEYSVPYSVGMVGLIYNTAMVSEAPTSWSALWDENYSGKILMFNNPRDAFAIAQSLLGIDYNTEAQAGWNAAADKLKEQKKVAPAYVNDEVFLKMESGESALAPYYAGDYYSMLENNSDLAFVYPKEGVNFFVDGACVLKNAQNKLAAELYINFLLEPEVALANAEYICYASPNTAVTSNPEYSFYNDEILYPEDGKFKTQVFTNLSTETLNLMSSLWEDVKSYTPGQDDKAVTKTAGDSNGNNSSAPYIAGISAFVGVCVIFIVFRAFRKKRRDNA